MPVTLDQLGRLSADQLRGAIGEIDGEISSLHLAQDGTVRRDLTLPEERKLDGLMNLRTRTEAMIVARTQWEKHPGSAELPFGQKLTSTTGPAVIPSDTRSFVAPDARQELRSRALAANDRCDTMPDAARTHMAAALQSDPDPESKLSRYVIATSDPDYMRAFSKWFADPVTGHREWDTRELAAYQRVASESRAMALGAVGTGGALVPYQLDPQILIAGTGSVNPMRELATVLPTAQNETRVVTSLGVTASWDAEAAEVSDDSPTLIQPSLTAFKGQAFLPVSVELFEDSDLQRQVADLFADAKAQLEADAFTLGNGTTAPQGVVTGVSAVGGSVVASALTVLSLVDIVANQNSLPPRWRANAKWMANLSMINSARQIPLYSNGPSIVNDATTPPRCLGWELYENSAMDGTIAAGATNDYVWLSGDFKRGYQIRDRVGTMLEFVPTLFGASLRPTGQRGFHMHWRTGGKVIIADAFRLTNYSG
jgi:HK97 family phage major capsid protein